MKANENGCFTSLKRTKVEILKNEGVITPVYSSETAAGADIFATEDIFLDVPRVVNAYINPNFKESKEIDEKDNPYYLYEVDENITDTHEAISVVKYDNYLMDTGFRLKIEPDKEVELRERSGLGIVKSIAVFNGTIDSDYRGTLAIKLTNLGTQPVKISKGDRIAQFVIHDVYQANFKQPSDTFYDTERGENGQGSTGK